jgi:hypothetical protein
MRNSLNLKSALHYVECRAALNLAWFRAQSEIRNRKVRNPHSAIYVARMPSTDRVIPRGFFSPGFKEKGQWKSRTVPWYIF